MDTHMCIHFCFDSMTAKDCGLRIRLEKQLREAFVKACREQNLGASDVLRDFMRAYTEKHHQGQGELFSTKVETID